MKSEGVKKDSGMSRFLQLQGSSLLVAIEKLAEKHAGFESNFVLDRLWNKFRYCLSQINSYFTTVIQTVEYVSLTKILCYTSCTPLS